MFKDEFYAIFDKAGLQELLKECKTPCYIYFLDHVDHKIETVRECLRNRFKIHYAVKANPHPAILRRMAQNGLGADVSSGGELKAVLAAGIDPGAVEFSGPGKTVEELSAAVEAKIGSVNAESIGELKILRRICDSKGKKCNAGIRVNPETRKLKSGISMGGISQFGMSEGDALAALEYLRDNSDKLNFTGLQVHAGSQVLDAESLCENIKSIMDLALELEHRSGMKMRKINFGGGWGIKYFAGQGGLDTDDIADILDDLFDESECRSLSQRANFIIEPGRYLTAECGLYVLEVLYRKNIGDRQFAITNGGMHHNYLLAGGMGQIVKRNFELEVFTNDNEIREDRGGSKFDIAGCLCTPQDILASGIASEFDILPGDKIVFFNCGAYGLTASPAAFLSHRPPGEYFVIKGKIESVNSK